MPFCQKRKTTCINYILLSFLKLSKFNQNDGRQKEAPLNEVVLGSSKLAGKLKVFYHICFKNYFHRGIVVG